MEQEHLQITVSIATLPSMFRVAHEGPASQCKEPIATRAAGARHSAGCGTESRMQRDRQTQSKVTSFLSLQVLCNTGDPLLLRSQVLPSARREHGSSHPLPPHCEWLVPMEQPMLVPMCSAVCGPQ